ncbi:MAG TPA: NAD(P)H-dependent oxidoreductase [Thermodesulfovibrionales bacterium]|nr:NAD(P)H-dependent oxidoreductase [Thermodesulfovibrionales bacterium]
MKVLVVLGHPQKGSFNHAIAETATRSLKDRGHEVFFHDLYEEKFDPILHHGEIPKDAPVDADLLKHCAELSEADGIIIVHPNWWGQPPAVLKGWVDRVVRPGVAYAFAESDSGEGVPIGLLKARVAMVFNTSNTKRDRELKVFGDPLEAIWRNCIFDLCGVKTFYRKMFEVIVVSTHEQRKKWLEEVTQAVDTFFCREDLL